MRKNHLLVTILQKSLKKLNNSKKKIAETSFDKILSNGKNDWDITIKEILCIKDDKSTLKTISPTPQIDFECDFIVLWYLFPSIVFVHWTVSSVLVKNWNMVEIDSVNLKNKVLAIFYHAIVKQLISWKSNVTDKIVGGLQIFVVNNTKGKDLHLLFALWQLYAM